MGNRANTVILGYDDMPPVIIYSHWGGKDLHSFVELVMDGEQAEFEGLCTYKPSTRIGDPSYFTAGMIERCARQGLLSGVSTAFDDNEHMVQIVDAMKGVRWTWGMDVAWNFVNSPAKEWREHQDDIEKADDKAREGS